MKQFAVLAAATLVAAATTVMAPLAADNADAPVQAHTTSISTINPYALLDLTREQLAERFPDLPDKELDLLLFKISDINSLRSLESENSEAP